MAAGIDHGGDDRTMRFDKKGDGQMAAADKGATVVVELQWKCLAVAFDPIGGRKGSVQEFVATVGTARGKIILRCLDIFSHRGEGNDRPIFHFWRRIDHFSSVIVTVGISPLA